MSTNTNEDNPENAKWRFFRPLAFSSTRHTRKVFNDKVFPSGEWIEEKSLSAVGEVDARACRLQSAGRCNSPDASSACVK